MTDERIGVELTITPKTKAQSHDVIERLTAFMTGLAMEGVTTTMTIVPFDAESEIEL